MGRSLPNHALHVEQVRRIGRKVVLHTLFIANVNHYIVEQAACRARINRYAKARLQHVLQQPRSL